MSTASLRQTVGRALLIAPPDWGRVVRFVVTAWLLALGGIWAAQQLHTTSHETLELTPAVHLLRDTSLAVPLAAIAIAIAGLVTVEAVEVLRLDAASVSGRLAFAVIAALVFAALTIPGQEAHGLLFGSEQETGNWLVDVALDSGVVLVAALAVLVPAALVRLAPWPPDVGTTARQPRLVRPSAGSLPSIPALERLGEQGVSRDA